MKHTYLVSISSTINAIKQCKTRKNVIADSLIFITLTPFSGSPPRAEAWISGIQVSGYQVFGNLSLRGPGLRDLGHRMPNLRGPESPGTQVFEDLEISKSRQKTSRMFTTLKRIKRPSKLSKDDQAS